MLPPAHRMRASSEFSAAVRQGRRASRPLLTVHALAPQPAPAATSAAPPTPDLAPARAGLVVSKAVGGSVVRHRTARRLRHLLAPHLTGPTADVPAGSLLVVRAAAGAGSASSAALRADLDSALRRLLPTSPGGQP